MSTLTTNTLPRARRTPTPTARAPRKGTTSPQAKQATAPRTPSLVGDQLPDPAQDLVMPIVEPPGQEQATDSSQVSPDTHYTHAAVGVVPQDQPTRFASSPRSQALADPALAFAADVLDDLEQVRNANKNRLRIMTTTGADKDGLERGFGLDNSHPDVAILAAMVTTMEALVNDATLQLQRQMRRHPLGAWVKAQPGIGEKQAARLLAAVGDPYWNTLYDRPRTVSELWSYCGLKPGQKRTKGQKSNWSTNAKTRAWLCIESALKCNGVPDKNGRPRALSPYRVIIDKRRAHTTTTHPDWTPGHSLNDGMRVAAKELLKDLWREARRVHMEAP